MLVDDLLVLEKTAAMLEDLGHAVVEARSGEEALALLRRTRTDEVRALMEVLLGDSVSKSFLTTTSDFAPRLRQ